LIDDTEHPFYPVVQFVPFLGMKTDNLKLPYGLRVASGKTLTWELIHYHARIHLAARPKDYPLEVVASFAYVAKTFVKNPNKPVYLNTNLVYHNIELDDDVRKKNLKEDMFILATLDSDVKVVVKDELRDFLNRPIIKECSGENRSYSFQKMIELESAPQSATYFEFRWAS